MDKRDEDDDDGDFPLNGLFAPMEKIFADFERFFSGFPMIFSIPAEDFNHENSQSSTSLRDEVLKSDSQSTIKTTTELLIVRRKKKPSFFFFFL